MTRCHGADEAGLAGGWNTGQREPPLSKFEQSIASDLRPKHYRSEGRQSKTRWIAMGFASCCPMRRLGSSRRLPLPDEDQPHFGLNPGVSGQYFG
jgi:hypothetical protein